MAILFPSVEFQKIKEHLVICDCALQNITVRINIILKDFSHFHAYNPVEHIKTRLKTPESIAEKLYRQKMDITAENARDYLTDIVGVRCICYYAKDIFYIADVLKKQPDVKIRSEKDYITNPKPSGYRSYHLILDVPVFLSDRTEHLPVEFQIRTQAMDFWASLEHKVKYKYRDKMPDHLSSELVDCANKIAELDNRMYLIQEIVDMAYLHKDAVLVERTFSTR